MITDAEIQKINEYARRVKAGETLTPEEEADRADLRRRFIEAFRNNLGAQLDSIKLQRPDGTLQDLKDLKKKKKKILGS